MKFIIDYWALIIVIFAAGGVGAFYLIRFYKKPNAEKLKMLNEWLLYAVFRAEYDLGSGTGALKLRTVYNMFISKFPDLANIISFDQFSKMVDNVLVKMREIMQNNEKINEFITGVN